jgi:hypothetical protein
MENIQAHLQSGRVSRNFPLPLEIRQTSLEATAASDHRLFQSVEAFQRFVPCRATAVYDVFPQYPRHAMWLYAHQDRVAVEEDRVEAARDDQTPACLIQAIQHMPSPTGRSSRGWDIFFDHDL